jgi:hypothetical protein
MVKFCAARVIKIVMIALVAVTVMSFIVMSLWNGLMPPLFGLRTIGFWQAMGILVLSKILFGFHGGFGARRSWRGRMEERWEKMTPEERDKFRQGMHGWCHHRVPAEPKASSSSPMV